MNQVINLVAENVNTVILVTLAINLILLVLFLITILRAGKVRRQYQALMKGVSQGNLEELLYKQADLLHQALDQFNQLAVRTEKLETEIEKCIQKTALVRFNAYDNMGSDLSFSLSLLDRHNNGVVLSSLYGREESRTYAKPIINGASSYPLSDEEEEVIKKANGLINPEKNR